MRMIGASLLSIVFLSVTAVAFGATPSQNGECATTTAACGKCGDGYCAKQCGETAKSCPADCGVETQLLACEKCGDGRCTPQCGETATSCPKDCGVESARLIVEAGD